MFDKPTLHILNKRLKSIPRIIVERDLTRDIDDLVAEILPPQKLAVVDDAHSSAAFGDKVYRALKGRFPCTHITLDKHPHADDETVQHLRTQTLSADALVAVGSGTINDLCKYVAHLDRKPYIVFPTAASMNGYLSANASITVKQHKKTMLAMMPLLVLCDMSVIAAAPVRLAKSGLGDALARSTAQTDWLLSHLLLDTHYDETPFQLLAPLEPELFDSARGIAMSDHASTRLLMQTLLLSGLGMTIAGGSYPASQGEHMIAHAMESVVGWQGGKVASNHSTPQPPNHPLHGETIAITTLAMSRMQQSLLRQTPTLRPDDFSSERMIGLFGSEATTQMRKAYDGKMALMEHILSPSPLKEGGLKNWPSIAEKLSAVSMPPERIAAILKAADAPMRPEQIGWHEEAYKTATDVARYTRERFTFLDLQ